MGITGTNCPQRIVDFPDDVLLDGVTVVELGSGRLLFGVDARRHTKVEEGADLALSIPEHHAGRAAQLLSTFRPGTFRGLYVGNGTISDADIEAAAAHSVEDLKLGWIHGTYAFSGHPAERLVLDAKPEAFGRLARLSEFTAHHCNFGDEALGELCAAPSLWGMILVDTQVSAGGLNKASRRRLRQLVYSDNKLVYPHAPSFGTWPDLASLTLDRVGLIDDQLSAITPLMSLEVLEVPNNDIFRRAFNGFDELPKLAWLDLSRTRISNTTIESLSTLQGLRRLDLSATAVTDDGLEALIGLDQLSHLHLGSCDITNDGLALIVEQHPNLAVLDISRTLITPETVPLLTRLPNLWRLELSHEMVCQGFLDMRDRFPKLQEFGFRGGFSDDDLAIELVDNFGAANFIGVR
jgi:hypothetical protein